MARFYIWSFVHLCRKIICCEIEENLNLKTKINFIYRIYFLVCVIKVVIMLKELDPFLQNMKELHTEDMVRKL